jgi:hypothetical protein
MSIADFEKNFFKPKSYELTTAAGDTVKTIEVEAGANAGDKGIIDVQYKKYINSRGNVVFTDNMELELRMRIQVDVCDRVETAAQNAFTALDNDATAYKGSAKAMNAVKKVTKSPFMKCLGIVGAIIGGISLILSIVQIVIDSQKIPMPPTPEAK